MIAWLWVVLAGCGLNHLRRTQDLPPFVSKTGRHISVPVEVAPGVSLDTHVQLPAGEGPWPTILIRYPYPIGVVLKQKCSLYARYGFACVWQSVRGRGQSDGEWYPFIHEQRDGLVTIDWILDQPWSNDRMAMLGESYLASTQWLLSGALPEEVKTLVPTFFGMDMYHNLYVGGQFRHELLSPFMTLVPERRFRPLAGRSYKAALDHRPRRTMDAVATGETLPWFQQFLDVQEATAPYWSSPGVAEIQELPERVRVPVLMIAGWSDAFLATQLATWQRLATRSESTLMIGPWNHLGAAVGDIPLENIDDEVGLADDYQQNRRTLDWLNHHLKDQPATFPVGATVSYVVRDNRWAVRPAWPPPTTAQTWHLGAGDARGCDGVLLPEASSTPPLRYRYDPADPTPSLGGSGSLAAVIPTYRSYPEGFADQGDLCARPDLVGWRSAPLDAPLHIAGTVQAKLSVSSDAPDTTFNVRILEELADGVRVHVREGIRALSFRDGDGERVAYTPGETVSLTIETPPIEYVFQPGSRILVQVSSASFPRFEAHTNTTAYWADATTLVVAEQILHLNDTTIVLPVVGGEANSMAERP
ncbi:MAG: CocE/NonD family hydrolase [Myxococcota bacterium]